MMTASRRRRKVHRRFAMAMVEETGLLAVLLLLQRKHYDATNKKARQKFSDEQHGE
jgi:hypothetical protein